MADENKLKASMFDVFLRFKALLCGGWSEFMDIVRGIELNADPSEVKDVVMNAVMQIQNIGNRDFQQRTSATWQTARTTARPLEIQAEDGWYSWTDILQRNYIIERTIQCWKLRWAGDAIPSSAQKISSSCMWPCLLENQFVLIQDNKII